MILGIAFSFPFLWMISTAVKTTSQVFRLPPELFPYPLHLTNFVEAWTGFVPFNRFLMNTLIIAVSATIGNLLSSSLVAFSFRALELAGSRLLFHRDPGLAHASRST